MLPETKNSQSSETKGVVKLIPQASEGGEMFLKRATGLNFRLASIQGPI